MAKPCSLRRVVHLLAVRGAAVDEVPGSGAGSSPQKVLLPFASHGSKLLAPLFHFPYLALVGESHQA